MTVPGCDPLGATIEVTGDEIDDVPLYGCVVVI